MRVAGSEQQSVDGIAGIRDRRHLVAFDIVKISTWAFEASKTVACLSFGEARVQKTCVFQCMLYATEVLLYAIEVCVNAF